jgi:hypothetical protein
MDNNKIYSNYEESEGRAPVSRRLLVAVLIALPCLMIIFGFLIGTLITPDKSNIIFGLGGYLPTVIILLIIGLGYSLLRNNPQLRRATLWTFRSYADSITGLDEREKLVVDQAYRSSYRTIVALCVLAMFSALVNVQTLHLTFHLGAVSFFYIALGIFGLLLYLPTAIVAWNEGI